MPNSNNETSGARARRTPLLAVIMLKLLPETVALPAAHPAHTAPPWLCDHEGSKIHNKTVARGGAGQAARWLRTVARSFSVSTDEQAIAALQAQHFRRSYIPVQNRLVMLH